MKKFMMFLIMLIPFVLIFTVQVTSVYIKATTYVAVERITFDKQSDIITKTTQDNIVLDFPAKIYPQEATNKEIEYISSDEEIATITQDGKITFVGFGTVTITAKSKASELINAQCEFFVTDTKPHIIKLLDYPTTLNVGKSKFVTSLVLPAEALDKSITYSSSNTGVATITNDGKITAISKGKCTITLETYNGIKNSFEIDVKVPVSGVEVDSDQKTIITGSNVIDIPTITVYPNNSNNKNYMVKSQNPQIADIQDGQIVFNKAGVVTFLVTTQDGGFTDSFSVQYSGGYFISAEILSEFTDLTIDYNYNQKLGLGLDVFPQDADMDNIRFESSNSSVVEVIGKDLIVKCGGRAVITMFAMTTTGEISSTANVFVKRNATNIVAEDIQISSPTHKLEYIVYPQDCTSDVEFELSSNLAQITSAGVLTFFGLGSVEVTIKTSCGLSKKVVVTYLKGEIKTLTITSLDQKFSVDYQDVFTLVFDVSFNAGAISFTNFDTSLLQYDSSTKELTAIKGGTTSLTATDGTISSQLEITIIRKAENLILTSTDVDLSKQVLTAKTSISISASIIPEDATTKVVQYLVDSEDIAGITAEGILTFRKAGTIVVTAKVDNIEKSYTIKSTFGLVEDFTLNLDSIVFEDTSETETLTVVSVVPSDYTLNINNIIYTSLNTGVVSASLDGKLTSIDRGITKVNVQIDNVVKSVDVQTKVKTTSIDIIYDGSAITSGSILGNTLTLSSKVYPDNANVKLAEWTLDDNTIATIDNGLVTFSGFGTVKVTVTTVDSRRTSSCYITRVESIADVAIESIDVYQGETLINNSNIEVSASSNSQVLRVQLGIEGLLDSSNINYTDVTTSVSGDDKNLININKQSDGYFTISRGQITKKLSVDIIFSIGGKSNTINITFNHLQRLTLDLNNNDDIKFGLERTRVFGTRFRINAETVDTLELNYSRYPANNEDNVYWFSSDSSIAYVNTDGKLVVINEDIVSGTKVTITLGDQAILDNCTITSSYTFTFVRGYNVYDLTGFNYCLATKRADVDNGINYTNYDVILHTSLGTSEDNIDANHYEELTELGSEAFYNNIYGNGYTINLENIDTEIIELYGEMRNLTIKGQNNADNISSFTKKICFYHVLEYVYFKNVYRLWTATSSAVYLKNCIVDGASQVGLQIGDDNTGKIYLENMIFGNIAQVPVDFQAGELYIKGFLDVYNYTKPDEFASGLSGLAMESVIKNAYQSTAFEKYVYKPSNEVSKYMANVAIAILPKYAGYKLSDRTVQDVYFYNKSTKSYKKSIDSIEIMQNGEYEGTGLGYEKVHYSGKYMFTEYNAYFFCTQVDAEYNYIRPTTTFDETAREKAYRQV